MNKCNACGMENASAARFCGTCGATLTPDINTAVKQAVAKKTSAANTRNIIGAVVIIVIALTIWGFVKNLDNADIKKVKETNAGIGYTYGQLLDGYCNSAKWTKFTSNAYEKVVEFTGKDRNGDKVLAQFSDTYGLYDGKYSIVYFEINGRATNEWEMANWLMNAAYYAK